MALLNIEDLIEIGSIMEDHDISFDTLTSLGRCLEEINEKLDP